MSAQDAMRERQREREHQTHQHNLNGAEADDHADREYLEALVDTDLSVLDEATKQLMSNMLTRDWALSNMSGAELNESRWLDGRVIKQQLLDAHPGTHTTITGEYRAALAGDEAEALSPLTPKERLVIDQVFRAFQAGRIPRSKEGFQQKELSSAYRVSEVRNDRDDSKGRLRGLW